MSISCSQTGSNLHALCTVERMTQQDWCYRHGWSWAGMKCASNDRGTNNPPPWRWLLHLCKEGQPHDYRTSPTLQDTDSIPGSPWDPTDKIIEFLALSSVINTYSFVRLQAYLRSSDWICNNRDHRSTQALMKTTSRHFVSLPLP